MLWYFFQKKVNDYKCDSDRKYCAQPFVFDKSWWRITHIEEGATASLILKLKAL